MPRRVVCLGDSITRGQLSADYVAMLSERTSLAPLEFTNAGVNGELAENVLRRLAGIVELQPDVVTVLIGSNDVVASMSAKSGARARRMNKLTGRPGIEGFADNVAAIVERLTRETSARIGLLSLPVLGEDLGSASVRRSQEYSAVLKKIAESDRVTYLPLNERQVEYLTVGGFQPCTHYRDNLALMVGGAIQHFLLRRSLDDISHRRGLQLTTDLLHQNTRGATMIADLIEEFVAG
ncbi:SGNH/GDSL hydrolase family protein [Mycobacterium dioxanotrophicus]|jgi:lysophospholipase L1-like esterase|nr:SGNH/GDSL hydrolase family protein [Mycobacterium dioxanotrophicus]